MSAAEEKAVKTRRKEDQALEEKQQASAAKANKIARLKALRLAHKPVTEENNG